MKSILLTGDQIEQLKKKYKKFIFSTGQQCVNFEIRTNDLEMVIYDSKKAVIKYDNCNFYWSTIEDNNHGSIIGCDETGVGDVFASVVAAAVFINDQKLEFLKKIDVNIIDSKKLSDEKISQIYNLIKNDIDYGVVVISNKIYNDFTDNGFNAHEIKTFAHYKALGKIISKVDRYDRIIIDQYANEKSMKKYTNHLKLKEYKNICLETKADDKYISVSIASIIARYYMICDVREKEKKYNKKLPLGSNVEVINVARELSHKYGKEFLQMETKISFKNVQQILK